MEDCQVAFHLDSIQETMWVLASVCVVTYSTCAKSVASLGECRLQLSSRTPNLGTSVTLLVDCTGSWHLSLGIGVIEIQPRSSGDCCTRTGTVKQRPFKMILSNACLRDDLIHAFYNSGVLLSEPIPGSTAALEQICHSVPSSPNAGLM